MTGEFPAAPPPSGRRDTHLTPAQVWAIIADLHAQLGTEHPQPRTPPPATEETP